MVERKSFFKNEIESEIWVRITRGLRKNVNASQDSASRYHAYKTVKGNRCDEYFSNRKDAEIWLKTFCPTEALMSFESSEIQNQTLEFAWNLYKSTKLRKPLMQQKTIDNRLNKAQFFSDLFPLKMKEITPKVIRIHIENEKEKSLANPRSSKRRCSFKEELKFLKSFFNWWREESEDTSFYNPILKKHFE